MKTIIQRLEADEFKQILDGEKSYIVFKGEAQSGQRILLQTETEELDCTVGLVATSPGVFKGHTILTLQRPPWKVPPTLEFAFDSPGASIGFPYQEDPATTTPATPAKGDTPIN